MLKTIENYGIQTILWAGVAVFAAMVMLPFYAKADEAECGVNHSRMNPTQLSAYQECWLDTYKADETHGVIGSLFWVKVSDTYYSTQIRNLMTNGQREAWLSGIATAEAAEMIVSDLEAELVVAEEAAKVVEMTVIMKDLGVYTDEQYEALAAMYDTKVMELTNQVLSTDKALDHMYSHIENLRDEIDELNAKLKAQPNVGNNSIVIETRTHIDGGDRVMLGDVKGYRVQNLYSEVNVDDEKRRYHINGNNMGLWGTADAIADLANEIGKIVDDAYEAGYEDGYAAGYADGFEDGVNSVK